MRWKFYVVAVACLFFSTAAFAQNSRSVVKKQIDSWGCCRSVALTLTGGDLALAGRNACVCPNVPVRLALELDNLQDEDEFIKDVQLTENEKWLILYGDNGLVWDGIPCDLESELREYRARGEIVTSVAFNDVGDWIVISVDNICASSQEFTEWIEEGVEMYGQLWTAHMTDDGVILCFETGFRLQGNVPDKVREALNETTMDVHRVKFLSDGSFFIADKDGAYSYYM